MRLNGLGLGQQGIAFSSEALAYFSRVEAASGSVVDKPKTNNIINGLNSILGLTNVIAGYLSCGGLIKASNLVSKAFDISSSSQVDIIQATGSLQPLYTANGLTYANDELDSPALGSLGAKYHGKRYMSGSCWIYPTTLATGTNRNLIISLFVDGASSSLYLTLTDTGKIVVYTRSVSTDSAVTSNVTATVAINTWYHLAWSIDFTGKTLDFFVNGVKQSFTSLGYGNNTYTQGTPAAGNYDTIGNSIAANRNFVGIIEHLVLTNITLDQTKVNSLIALGR